MPNAPYGLRSPAQTECAMPGASKNLIAEVSDLWALCDDGVRTPLGADTPGDEPS